jgi:putative two-component system response regulator
MIKKILIVDDDELLLAGLSQRLEKAGYQTVTARDGRRAIDIISRGEVRIVIADWLMPVMDGLDLCRWVRSSDLMHYVYVILLTARTGQQDMADGMAAGADAFMPKPFNTDELVWRIRAAERMLALETRDVTIFALAKLAESRDPETGAHLERVRNYTRMLAKHLSTGSPYRGEIDDAFIRLMYQTSPLHDIGKVGIPDTVLLKPGRLNDREFEIMKTHAEIGANTLAAAAEQYPDAAFLRMAHDIALTHHEQFDGTGYPRGLAGDDIPLCGRIMALADVYDALTSKRVYKQSMTHEVARDIITAERGKQFDPHVVDAFVELEPAFIAVNASYSDPVADAA